MKCDECDGEIGEIEVILAPGRFPIPRAIRKCLGCGKTFPVKLD